MAERKQRTLDENVGKGLLSGAKIGASLGAYSQLADDLLFHSSYLPMIKQAYKDSAVKGIVENRPSALARYLMKMGKYGLFGSAIGAGLGTVGYLRNKEGSI